MRHYYLYILPFLISATAVALPPSFIVSFGDTVYRDVKRTDEVEIVANIELAAGSLHIGCSNASKIVEVTYEPEEIKESDFYFSYRNVDGKGYLKIESKDHRFIHDGDARWNIRVNGEIPITLKVELGAGAGKVNLTGLQIKELRLSTGASSVKTWCDKPNSITAERVVIETGVGSFNGDDMANLNFKKMNFSGGVGSYTIDFGGDLRQDGKVNLELGLGSISLSIPKEASAKIERNTTWFTGFNIDKSFVRTNNDTYESKGTNPNKLLIKVEAGMGSVKIKKK